MNEGKPPGVLEAGGPHAGKVEPLTNAAAHPRITMPPPWKPFPIDALPSACRRLAVEGAKARGIDPAYLGVPMLGVLAGAIGNSGCLRIKRSYTEPAILWVTVVAPSGTIKSSSLDDLLRASRARDHALLQETHKAYVGHEQAMLRYRAERDEYQKSRKRKDAVRRDPPMRPELPPRRAVLAEDVTAEALAERLADNPRGLLLALDELAGWIGRFDAYKNTHGADVNKYLPMHRGGPMKVDRKSGDRPTIFVPRAALSIVGTVQPRTLARVIGQANRENGLLARLFVAMPPAAFAPWTEDDVAEGVYLAYERVVGALLDLGGEMRQDGEMAPIELTLTAEARGLWRNYHDRMMQRGAAVDEDLSAAFSKLRGGALRIALVIALARAAEEGRAADLREVDAEAMRAGIIFAEWFAHEAERVYAVLDESQDDRELRLLIEFVKARGGRVKPYELAHAGPRCYRGKAEDAEKALQRLVSAGFGSWDDGTPGPRGGRPSRVFVLEPAWGGVAAQTREFDGEAEVSDATPATDDFASGDGRAEQDDPLRMARRETEPPDATELEVFVTGSSPPSRPTAPCPGCGGCAFWRHRGGGGWLCDRCHPSLGEGVVAERLNPGSLPAGGVGGGVAVASPEFGREPEVSSAARGTNGLALGSGSAGEPEPEGAPEPLPPGPLKDFLAGPAAQHGGQP